MRQMDRYWWLGLLASLVIGAAALAFVIWQAVLLWDVIQFDSTYGGDPELDSLAGRSTGIAVAVGIVGLVFAWTLFKEAHVAHKRRLGRMQALAGNPNAIPPAQITASPAQAPDLEATGNGQFRLLWQATAAGRRYALIGYAVVQLMLGIFFISMLFMFFAVFSQIHFSFGLDWRSAQLIGALALFVLFFGGLPIGLMIFTSPMRSILIQPYGVIATPNGLTSVAANGKATYIPWSEARVLEVFFSSSSGTRSQRRYQLYGTRSSVEWLDAPPKRWLAVIEPPDASLAEYERQHQFLLNLIAARTDLVPRTFGKEPKTPDPSHLGEISVEVFSQDRPWGQLGCLGIVVALVASLSALIIFLPLSQSPLLNLIVAGALLLAPALGFVNALTATLIRSFQPEQAPSPPPIELPAEYDPAVTYALREQRTTAIRLRDFVLGLLLGVCVAPGVTLLFPDAVSTLIGSDARIGDGFAWWLALALALIGVLGLLLAFGAARGIGTYHELSADATGLSELMGGEWRRQATWDAITDFCVRHEGGDRYLYLAIRKAELPVIWSARERSRAAGTVIEGRHYVSRDGFAAVVAERVGTPLKTLVRVRKKRQTDS
jgi:hypothetical protein